MHSQTKEHIADRKHIIGGQRDWGHSVTHLLSALESENSIDRETSESIRGC
jgi:hypothetical protein